MRRTPLIIATAILFSSVAVPHLPVAAQSASQQHTDALQDALRRIARNPENSSALADAGLAALAMGDTRAAIGFLAKADEIYPTSGRVKEGLGRALLAEENPFGAIRYFNQAVQNGIPTRQIAGDRGLAFDLIGRNAEAQQDYELALQYGQDQTLLKRYAISLGISGNLEKADAQLNPLLQQSDRDAWRNKAFIHAMNGQEDEANSIARQMMPRRMADAIKPFFDRMPKLTAAQKAAAVHYGHFPASENIGVDVAAVRLASGARMVRGGTGADAGLIPVGPPLGENIRKPRVLAMPDESPRRRPGAGTGNNLANASPDRARQLANVRERVRAQTEAMTAKPGSGADLPAVKVIEKLPAPNAVKADAAPIATAPIETASVGDGAAGPAVPPMEKVETAAMRSVSGAGFETNLGVGSSSPLVSESVERKVAIGTVQPKTEPSIKPEAEAVDSKPAPITVGEGAGPVNLVNFDLAAAGNSKSGDAADSEGAAATKPLSDIMKSIEIPETERKSQVVPVDLEKIEAARPNPPKLKTVERKPEPPAHPKRFWVQIATGSDRDALRYDYRRMARKHGELFKGKQGWTSPWGRTRRLVVGPFDNLKLAKSFEADFRKGGGDGFAWVSANGTEVNKLTQ